MVICVTDNECGSEIILHEVYRYIIYEWRKRNRFSPLSANVKYPYSYV